jgi:MoaA/NifB/PqqE/SkfB family radical SAM enzyme
MATTSLYWDDFERRAIETVNCLNCGKAPPVRRVAIFITERCNFRCSYCNSKNKNKTLTEERFCEVVDKYGKDAIIHITGGEPSTVPWLFPRLIAYNNQYRFHLNTNAYIAPPSEYVKRIKISLDNSDPIYWNKLVGREGAFEKVIANIKEAVKHTVVSLTYTLTHENFAAAPEFARFVAKELNGLYAVFFSVYKGKDARFAFTDEDAESFFKDIIPKLKESLNAESIALIGETINEKRRLIQGVRFPQNINEKCYLSMSERVISPDGAEYTCSHLYRDGIYKTEPTKHEKCLYGCNQRLVHFNDEVAKKLE